MLNPATNPVDGGFNSFTRLLKNRIEAGEKVLVELRDCRIVELGLNVDTEGNEHFCFRKGDANLIWKTDGTSITNSDFDIMGDAD